MNKITWTVVACWTNLDGSVRRLAFSDESQARARAALLGAIGMQRIGGAEAPADLAELAALGLSTSSRLGFSASLVHDTGLRMDIDVIRAELLS